MNKALGDESVFRSGGPDVKEVTKNSMPWLVFLPLFGLSDSDVVISSICGGTLIGKRHVLSAAHCPPHDFVIVGEHSISKDDGEQIKRVARFEDHPKWGIYLYNPQYLFKILNNSDIYFSQQL